MIFNFLKEQNEKLNLGATHTLAQQNRASPNANKVHIIVYNM